MHRLRFFAAALLAVFFAGTNLMTLEAQSDRPAKPADSDKQQPAPPVARKAPKETKMHGVTLADDYAWLREKSNPEVIKHLEAENAYAESFTAATKPLQEKLYKEFLGRIKQTDVTVPYRLNGYYYFSRTEEGKQYKT